MFISFLTYNILSIRGSNLNEEDNTLINNKDNNQYNLLSKIARKFFMLNFEAKLNSVKKIELENQMGFILKKNLDIMTSVSVPQAIEGIHIEIPALSEYQHLCKRNIFQLESIEKTILDKLSATWENSNFFLFLLNASTAHYKSEKKICKIDMVLSPQNSFNQTKENKNSDRNKKVISVKYQIPYELLVFSFGSSLLNVIKILKEKNHDDIFVAMSSLLYSVNLIHYFQMDICKILTGLDYFVEHFVLNQNKALNLMKFIKYLQLGKYTKVLFKKEIQSLLSDNNSFLLEQNQEKKTNILNTLDKSKDINTTQSEDINLTLVNFKKDYEDFLDCFQSAPKPLSNNSFKNLESLCDSKQLEKFLINPNVDLKNITDKKYIMNILGISELNLNKIIIVGMCIGGGLAACGGYFYLYQQETITLQEEDKQLDNDLEGEEKLGYNDNKNDSSNSDNESLNSNNDSLNSDNESLNSNNDPSNIEKIIYSSY